MLLRLGLVITTTVVFLMVATFTSPIHASANAEIWFVQAGANGDGKSFLSPIGSPAALEDLSSTGDIIYLLASEFPLEGGIALKHDQRLIGLSDGAQKPVITNSNVERNGGCGIVLSNNTSVSNVKIIDTVASGIYGADISAISIDDVDVYGANRSKLFIDASYPTLPGSLPHGGMTFVHTKSPAEVVVTSSSVFDAAGFGIVSVTSEQAHSSLKVSHTEVQGGTKMGFFDAGISSLVHGSAARARLDVFASQIWGRLSRSGRNIMLVASGGSQSVARVERSFSGATGQDGIVAAVMQSPSKIDLFIGDSLIEDAGQMNVEGSIINLDSADPLRINEGHVAIEINNSIIRNAGAIGGFEHIAANIWLGGSQFIENRKPSNGSYKLSITESKITDAGRAGLEIGNLSVLTKGQPEESEYDIFLKGNTIINNGEADAMIYAPNATVNARGNCWGQPNGLADDRVKILSPAKRSQLDVSEPISCDSLHDESAK